MIDEARMADDGCTNEPIQPLVTGYEIMDLLDIIESLAESEAGEYGNGLRGRGAVEWAAESEAGLQTYLRLRLIYPKESS